MRAPSAGHGGNVGAYGLDAGERWKAIDRGWCKDPCIRRGTICSFKAYVGKALVERDRLWSKNSVATNYLVYQQCKLWPAQRSSHLHESHLRGTDIGSCRCKVDGRQVTVRLAIGPTVRNDLMAWLEAGSIGDNDVSGQSMPRGCESESRPSPRRSYASMLEICPSSIVMQT